MKSLALPINIKLALAGLLLFSLVAVLAPFLASDIPLHISYKGQNSFPLFSGKKVLLTDNNEVVKLNYHTLTKHPEIRAHYTLVPFKPVGATLDGADYQTPLTVINGRTHWLGTNQIGEDTLAGIIQGGRISLQIGVFSMLIALFIGLIIGTLAGYYGNSGLSAAWWQIGIVIIMQPIFIFYMFIVPFQVSEIERDDFLLYGLLFSMFYVVANALLIFGLNRIKVKSKRKVNVPLDSVLGRSFEFIDGLPTFMVLISFSVILNPSIYFLMLLIGLTAWISIARYTRAEVLKLKNSDFLNAMKVMGAPSWLIIIRHLIPNALGPAIVAFTFGVARAILFESALSFIGIGLPNDIKSWGMILAESRQHLDAWWLLWSPGLCIFLLILCVNTIGQYLRKRLTPAEFVS